MAGADCVQIVARVDRVAGGVDKDDVQSNEGRDYLSLKLDDPSFTAPIFANLFDDPDGESYTLIWSRSRKKNGE